MSKINIFSVHPFGMSFATSDMDITRGDTRNAFFRAHLSAARQAANLMIPSHVLRDDRGEERMGFGPGAESKPSSDLYKILQMGLASYWDHPTCSWMPTPRAIHSEEREAGKLLVV